VHHIKSHPREGGLSGPDESGPDPSRDRLLALVERPGRYLAAEINAVVKDPRQVAVRLALVFPDLYEIGKSYLGLEILYQILNQQEDIWAERAFSPWLDAERELRRLGLPLASLESGTPLAAFDLIGISLQYELSYTNILTLLELGGVPWLADHRGPADPVVVGGGPGAFNPEPLAPFFDAIVIGDGEDVIIPLARTVQAWKAGGGSRAQLWAALEELEGVYVPALFQMDFDASGQLQEILPRGRRERVRKRLVPDLDRLPALTRPLVPHIGIVHDRLNVEIARGCTRGCRFCQAGMLYRPVREKSPADVLAWAEGALAATGFGELSLLSLSSGDYGCLTPLLTALMNRFEADRVAVSLPSLRADTLTAALMDQIRRVRKTGFTIAPEAGSERLRRMINKNLSNAEIVAAVRQAFTLGWNLVKLYFMLGFPMETPEDRQAIAGLSREVLAAARDGSRPGRLHISFSTFIPKPHTPLQWERQLCLAETRELLQTVKQQVAHKGIDLKWNPAPQSWLEGIFARGDRRLAPVLMAAQRRGCRFDAWSEHLSLSRWQEAFQDCRVDPEFYLRARRLEEALPWNHLDCGVSPEFLRSERQRAWQGLPTPDCRGGDCQDCGVCDHQEIRPRVFSPPASGLEVATPAAPAGDRCFYRLYYARLDEARWISHLELMTMIHRGLRRSQLPLCFTQGFHPLPRVSFYGALPLGVESLAEVMDLELAGDIPAPDLAARLNACLPPGIRILTVTPLPRKLPAPVFSHHHWSLDSSEALFQPEAIAAFHQRRPFLVEQRKPKGTVQIDLHDLVADLRQKSGHSLEVTLKYRERHNLKVAAVAQAIFGLSGEQTKTLHIIKRQSS